MASVLEIMQLCRLCLEKDEVNTPIFEGQGDIRQIFLKISACLPVKVSKEDKLPKNICDGCSCKLEMLYQFWNTSANAEKKLIRWLDQIGTDKLSDKEEAAVPLQSQHSISSVPVVLKQEVDDVVDSQSTGDDIVPDDLNVSNDSQEYLLQQEQLPYQPVEFQFQQDGFDPETADDDISQNVESDPLPKQRKRRAAAMKTLPTMDSEDEDDPDLINTKIAKTEEQSEESGGEDMTEPTTFVGVPSADDDEQPGPSGVGKTSGDAPLVHGTTTHPTKPYQCQICWKSFTLPFRLKRHMAVHSEERHYSCDICPTRFKFKAALSNHMKVIHSPILLHKCEACNKTCKSAKDLEAHQNRHMNKFTHFCEICKKGYFTTHEVRIHVMREHEKIFFECNICQKKYSDQGYLKKHIKTHDDAQLLVNKTFKCDLCDKVFSSKKTLRIHCKLHSGENTYVCDICGKSVLSRTSLLNHLMLHKGDKPYKCEECEKSFSTANYLRVHTRSHTGLKPYKCEDCSKSFTQRSSLVIHMRYHSGDRPYQCDLCDGAFVAKTLLNVHKKNVHCVV